MRGMKTENCDGGPYLKRDSPTSGSFTLNIKIPTTAFFDKCQTAR